MTRTSRVFTLNLPRTIVAVAMGLICLACGRLSDPTAASEPVLGSGGSVGAAGGSDVGAAPSTVETGGGATVPSGGSRSSGGDFGEGSGGEGGSSEPVDDSLVAACQEYERARCERLGACDYPTWGKDCGQLAVENCPDRLFSDGSTHTPETARDCAEEWRSFTCLDLHEERLPECETRKGTRAEGDACLFDNQCEEECVYALNAPCGSCGIKVDTCGKSNEVCRGLSACNATRCVPPVPHPDTLVTPAPIAIGEACSLGAEHCVQGALCALSDGADEHLCLKPPLAGEACYLNTVTPSVFYACAEGLACRAEDTTCQPLPVEDAPCLIEAKFNSGDCAAGLFCEGKEQICRAPGLQGESCLYPNSSVAGFCQRGMVCTDGTCFARLQLGQVGCSYEFSECEHGTTCVMDTCEADDVARRFIELCGQ